MSDPDHQEPALAAGSKRKADEVTELSAPAPANANAEQAHNQEPPQKALRQDETNNNSDINTDQVENTSPPTEKSAKERPENHGDDLLTQIPEAFADFDVFLFDIGKSAVILLSVLFNCLRFLCIGIKSFLISCQSIPSRNSPIHIAF